MGRRRLRFIMGRGLAASFLAGTALAACNAITGVDDYGFASGASSSSTGAGPTTGSTSTSTSTATSSSASSGSGGASSSSSSSGSGGTGGNPCGGGTFNCDANPDCETNGVSDPFNCGGCNKPCGQDHVCENSMCTCAPGLTQNGSGCVDLNSDPNNCGMIGKQCPGMVCKNKVCVAACNADGGGGLATCNGACVDTDKNPLYCGDCQTHCGAGEACVGGHCKSYSVPIGCTSCPCNCPATMTTCCSVPGWPFDICVSGQCDF